MIRRKKCLITKLLLQKLKQNSETAIEKCVGFLKNPSLLQKGRRTANHYTITMSYPCFIGSLSFKHRLR